ncbi:MAG: ABC transporter ATP-binding protein [Desulfatitalea sp.]|nr:ABC transporter ATP-binding protein [Desulfatitalea sp.]NNK01406.1 ABC transporter ATP-binding protein [Desulfatitalea sp.]
MSQSINPSVLVCRDLCIGYKDKPVLAGVNLNLRAGHFVSLLGPNGAGKTTLLRTLSRHLAPLSGGIEIEGRALSALSATDLAKIMAVVLTEKISPPLFTVAEFVALGRYPHTDFLGRTGAADHAAVMKALAAVRAENLAGRTFADLSDGERQKALVARALAQQPRLLLLDEPTLHLDLKHRLEVMAILRNLCRTQKITVLASLHDVDVAAKVSDRVALIKKGGLSAWGSPEQVLTEERVADLYDFNGATFSNLLGGIEMRGDGTRGRAFVVAGMGSGAQIFRLLAKRGFGIATGVLHTNDLDYYVASSLGAACAAQTPMQAIDTHTLAAADQLLAGCDVVIDCGFEVGPMNQGNLTLVQNAVEAGRAVYSLRANGAGPPDGGQAGHGCIRCQDPGHLLDRLESHLARNRGASQGL